MTVFDKIVRGRHQTDWRPPGASSFV